MLYVTFADGYVTVDQHPWGHGDPDHQVGPVEDEFADVAVEGVAKLLRSLGHRVLTPENAAGHWDGQGRYIPHPDDDAEGDRADVPVVV